MRKTLFLPALAILTFAAGVAAAECDYSGSNLSTSIYLIDPLRDPVPLDAVQDLLPNLSDPPPLTQPRQEHIDSEDVVLRDRLAEAILQRLNKAGKSNGVVIRTLGDGRKMAQVPVRDWATEMLILRRGPIGFFHVLRAGDIAAAAGPDEIVARSADGRKTYLLDADPILTGESVTESGLGYHPRTGQPVVNFRFDDAGREVLAAYTASNVGQIFAIVLDGTVLSAPRILSPILGGAGFIEGNFDIEKAQATALLLNSEPLPGKVRLLGVKAAAPVHRNGAIDNSAVLIEFTLHKPGNLGDICDRLSVLRPADISLQKAENSGLLIWVESGDGQAPEEIAQAAADALGGIADLYQVERAGPNLARRPKSIIGNIRKWFD